MLAIGGLTTLQKCLLPAHAACRLQPHSTLLAMFFLKAFHTGKPGIDIFKEFLNSFSNYKFIRMQRLYTFITIINIIIFILMHQLTMYILKKISQQKPSG